MNQHALEVSQAFRFLQRHLEHALQHRVPSREHNPGRVCVASDPMGGHVTAWLQGVGRCVSVTTRDALRAVTRCFL